MVCWQISITAPPLPLYCLAAFGLEEISSNLIKHGENKQRFKQHTSQVNMHQQRSAFGPELMWACMCVCVCFCVRACVCLLAVILSVFSMKPSLSAVHKQQWRSARVGTDCSRPSLICWVLLWHTSKHITCKKQSLKTVQRPFIGHTEKDNI